MALPTYEEFVAQKNKRRQEMDSQLSALGYQKVGNRYLRVPTEQEQEKDQIQSLLDKLGLEDKLNARDPEKVKEKALLEAQAKSEAEAAFPSKPNDQQIAFTAVKGLIPQIEALFNQKGDLPGVGALGTGTAASFLYGLNPKLGGGDKGEEARIAIGQIQSTLAKLRGGTSFTPNEERLLKTYTPNIGDSPSRIRQKLSGLKTYISKLDASYNFTGSSKGKAEQQGPPTPGADPLGIR